MSWVPLTVAIVFSAMFAVMEWRRRDTRHRAARVVSIIIAATSLALLGLPRAETNPAPRLGASAVLWTPGGVSSSAIPQATHAFALPGVAPLPAGAISIPDVAYLRRHYPEISSIHIVSEGVEPFESDGLRDVAVTFERSIGSTRPQINLIEVPLRLHVGEPARLRGFVDGLPAESQATLHLHAPDGTATQTSIKPDAEGRALFDLRPAAVHAEGRFTWRLQLTRQDAQQELLASEIVGIPVVSPTLPRVLILEQSPQVESAHLRRWLGELGAAFTSRTAVSEERYRFTSAGDAPKEFTTVDTTLLTQFDVVVAELRALASLAPSEQDAIRAAVEERGLGLLVSPAGEKALVDARGLAPWKLNALVEEPTSSGVQSRSARVQWRGLDAPPEEPIEIENLELVADPAHAALVSDLQGRTIVAATSRRRGHLGITLARATWRWRLADRPELFASYWSFLFNRFARREEQPRGWTISDPQRFPIIVDQPLELSFSAGRDAAAPARVTSRTESAVLPLAADVDEPTRWRSTYWPREPGWHRVEASSGEHLDFYVDGRDAWNGLRAARRRAVTERLAVLKEERPAAADRRTTEQAVEPHRAAAAFLFALFLISSSYLALERRRAI